MNRLRRVLEPDQEKPRLSQYILHDVGRYRFNYQAPHWLDVTAFQELAASKDPANLAEAVNLYRGQYLADAAWDLPVEVEVERRILEQCYVDVLRRLIELSQSDETISDKVEIYLRKLLTVEPLDEDAQRILILSTKRMGVPIWQPSSSNGGKKSKPNWASLPRDSSHLANPGAFLQLPTRKTLKTEESRWVYKRKGLTGG